MDRADEGRHQAQRVEVKINKIGIFKDPMLDRQIEEVQGKFNNLFSVSSSTPTNTTTVIGYAEIELANETKVFIPLYQ